MDEYDEYRISVHEVKDSKVTIDLLAPPGFPGMVKLEIQPVEVVEGAPGFPPLADDLHELHELQEAPEEDVLAMELISYNLRVTPGAQRGTWKAIATFLTSYGDEICKRETTFEIP